MKFKTIETTAILCGYRTQQLTSSNKDTLQIWQKENRFIDFEITYFFNTKMYTLLDMRNVEFVEEDIQFFSTLEELEKYMFTLLGGN